MAQTRKRDGSSVGTPVNVAVAGDRAYFGTPANTAKVKRLRNFPEAEIAPCTIRGKPTGPSLKVRARLLEGEAAKAAARLLTRKYRVVYGLLVPLELRIKAHQRLVLRAHRVPGRRARAPELPNPPQNRVRRAATLRMRSPESNRGHHEFQSAGTGWLIRRKPHSHAVLVDLGAAISGAAMARPAAGAVRLTR